MSDHVLPMNTLKPRTILLLFSLAAAVLLLLLTAQGGVITTPDSATYIAASRSLVAGDGYRLFDGHALTRWPPLYPTLLAFVGMLSDQVSINLLEGIRLFNALVYAVTVFAAGVMFLRLIASPLLALMAIFTLLVNWPLTMLGLHAWSEPFFVLLTVLVLLQLARFLQAPTWLSLLGLAALAALGALQRYAGVTLILTGLLVILIWANVSQRQRFLYAACFGLLAAAPLLLWNLRNLALNRTLVGSAWEIASARPLKAITTALQVLGEPFAPPIGALPLLAGCALGVAVLLYLLRIARVTRAANPYLLCLVLFTAIYLTFMILSSSVANVTLDNRTLVPVFIPLTGLVFFTLHRLRSLLRPRILAPIAVILALPWLGISRWERLSHEYPLLHQNCCRNTTWEESPFVAWLKDQHFDHPLWSNDTLNGSVYTGLTLRQMPTDPLASWMLTPDIEYYIVWFNLENQPRDALDALIAEVPLEPLVEMADGGVYRFRIG